MYLFDCHFDESVEDYEDCYHVSEMPVLTDGELVGSWANLSDRVVRKIGTVAVAAVKFDPTRRAGVSPGVFERLTAADRRAVNA